LCPFCLILASSFLFQTPVPISTVFSLSSHSILQLSTWLLLRILVGTYILWEKRGIQHRRNHGRLWRRELPTLPWLAFWDDVVDIVPLSREPVSFPHWQLEFGSQFKNMESINSVQISSSEVVDLDKLVSEENRLVRGFTTYNPTTLSRPLLCGRRLAGYRNWRRGSLTKIGKKYPGSGGICACLCRTMDKLGKCRLPLNQNRAERKFPEISSVIRCPNQNKDNEPPFFLQSFLHDLST